MVMSDDALNIPNLNADDEAEADLPRQARAQQFRQTRRAQVSTALPALLLIILGLLYLLNPVELTPPLAIGFAVGALGLSMIARFLLNVRRERGLFFVGLVILSWVGFTTVVITRGLIVAQVWPLLIMALGLAALLTFLFERNHERGLILPGFLLIAGGGIALLFTLGLVSGEVLRLVATYWPVIFVLLALALLPRTFRDRTN